MLIIKTSYYLDLNSVTVVKKKTRNYSSDGVNRRALSNCRVPIPAVKAYKSTNCNGEYNIPRFLKLDPQSIQGFYTLVTTKCPSTSYLAQKKECAEESEGAIINKKSTDTIDNIIDWLCELFVEACWFVCKWVLYLLISCYVLLILLSLGSIMSEAAFWEQLYDQITSFFNQYISIWGQYVRDVLAAEISEISSRPELLTFEAFLGWFLFLWVKLVTYTLVGLNCILLVIGCICYPLFFHWASEMIGEDEYQTFCFWREFKNEPFMSDVVFKNRGYLLGSSNYDVLTKLEVDNLKDCAIVLYARFMLAAIIVGDNLFSLGLLQGLIWVATGSIWGTRLTFWDLICMK